MNSVKDCTSGKNSINALQRPRPVFQTCTYDTLAKIRRTAKSLREFSAYNTVDDTSRVLKVNHKRQSSGASIKADLPHMDKIAPDSNRWDGSDSVKTEPVLGKIRAQN